MSPVMHASVRPPGADLRDSLDRWVEAGLVTREQAKAISRAEAEPGGPPPRRQRRVPLVAEVLGYLGAVLALAAGAILVGQHWGDLAPAAHIAIAAVVTVALWLGGWILRDADERALERLAAVLWLLSVGAFAWLGAILADDVWKPSPEATAAVVSACTALYAATLWAWRQRSLQLVALAGAGVATAGWVAAFAGVSPEWISLVVWGFGLAWFIGAWRGALRPPTAAYVLGALPILLGPWTAVGVAEPMMFLGLASAAALMAGSVPLRQTPVLFLGAIGMFGFVTAIVIRYFADTIGASAALLLAGLVMIAIALVTARLYRRSPQKGAPSG